MELDKIEKDLAQAIKGPQFDDPLKQIRKAMRAFQVRDPGRYLWESIRLLRFDNPLKGIEETMKAFQFDIGKDPWKSMRLSNLFTLTLATRS